MTQAVLKILNVIANEYHSINIIKYINNMLQKQTLVEPIDDNFENIRDCY